MKGHTERLNASGRDVDFPHRTGGRHPFSDSPEELDDIRTEAERVFRGEETRSRQILKGWVLQAGERDQLRIGQQHEAGAVHLARLFEAPMVKKP